MCKWFVHPNACAEGYTEARLVDGVLEATGVICADLQDVVDLRIEGPGFESATREMLRKLDLQNTEIETYVGGGDMLSTYVRKICAGEYSDIALPKREEQLNLRSVEVF
jgi:hypothetical protein